MLLEVSRDKLLSATKQQDRTREIMQTPVWVWAAAAAATNQTLVCVDLRRNRLADVRALNLCKVAGVNDTLEKLLLEENKGIDLGGPGGHPAGTDRQRQQRRQGERQQLQKGQQE